MIYFIILILTLITYQDRSQNIIEMVQKKYESISDISADLIQGNNTSKFYFKKPNKFRIEMKNATLVSDGNSVYNYNKKREQCTISNYESNALSPEYLLFNLPKNNQQKIETELINNQKFYKITFDTSKEKLNYKQMTVWVDKDYLITKISVTENSGNVFQFSLKNIEINKNINNNHFSFKIPSGVKVIDLR